MLASPMLDDRTAESHPEVALTWTAQNNRQAWQMLLGDEHDRRHLEPYASPARALDLTGLGSCYLDVGTADLFHDETVTFARRLRQAGSAVELHEWRGGWHGFDLLMPEQPIARAAFATRRQWIAAHAAR